MKKISRSAICWSADVDDHDLTDVIKSGVLPVGTMIKLDQVFFEQYNKSMIFVCQDAGYPVFIDRKICEIPEKALAIATIYLRFHPYMINVMAGICSTGVMEDENTKKIDALKRFAVLCDSYGTRSCAVTVLTSKTPDMVREEFGTLPQTQVEKYAQMMVRSGLTDIVCPPTVAKRIHKNPFYDRLTINTPGVRLPNTDARDQAQITTPAEALNNGADVLVIGSNLTDGDGRLIHRLEKNYQRLEDHLRENGYTFKD